MSKPLSTEEIQELRVAWLTAAAYLRLDNRVEYWFSKALEQYSEPHRHYHVLRHLHHMLSFLHSADDLGDEFWALCVFFIFFHDWVYRTEFTKIPAHSEKVSAHIGYCSLRDMGLDEVRSRLVEKWILASTHKGDVDGANTYVLDLDLLILSTSEEAYDEYCSDVRKEFGWVPEEQWRKGRADFLKGMLAKDKIFMTRPLEENAARANMARELQRLEF